MKRTSWAAGLLLAIVAANCSPPAVRRQIDDAAEERRIIAQFYNYVESIARIKLDNMLETTKVFVEQLLDSIPHRHRGDTALMLQQYIDKTEQVQHVAASVQDKELLLLELQQLIGTFKKGLLKQEREDIILRRGVMGMFELLARLSIEERKFNEKFDRAAHLLRARFAPAAVRRHQRLFDLLQWIGREEDIVRREVLMKRLKKMQNSEL